MSLDASTSRLMTDEDTMPQDPTFNDASTADLAAMSAVTAADHQLID
jgi:hypothetical protein